MAYIINKDLCIQCGECAAACPTETINQIRGAYEINQDYCMSCGTCAVNCPAAAIEDK